MQAIISMAKALDMCIVAEGVEREEQIARLSEMGCDYLQGFLLSRPTLAADMPSLLKRRHALLGILDALVHEPCDSAKRLPIIQI